MTKFEQQLIEKINKLKEQSQKALADANYLAGMLKSAEDELVNYRAEGSSEELPVDPGHPIKK